MSAFTPDEADDEIQFVLVGEDGKSHGPMPRARVVELLERDFVTERDRVGREGGEKMPIRIHPDFAGYFIEGDSRQIALERAREERAASKKKHRGRDRENRAKRMLFYGALIVLPFVVFEFRFTLFPDPVLDWMHARVYGDSDAVGGRVASGGESGGQGAATRQNPDAVVHFVRGLRKKHPPVQMKAPDLYEEGWQALIGGTQEGKGIAVQKMEMAVIGSEGAPWSLAGLAAAYAAKDSGTEAGSRNLDKIVAMLKRQPDAIADLNFAQAAIALFKRDHSLAFRYADDCRRQADGAPECHWMAAAAMGRSGSKEDLRTALEPALQAYPDSPELNLWSAALAIDGENWSEATALLESIEATQKDRAEFKAERGRLRMRTGQFDGAREDFSALATMEGDDRSAALLEAVILYQIEGLHAEAFGKLKATVEGDLEDFSQAAELYLHASHSARAAGDAEAALEMAKLAVAEGGLVSESLLAKAMAFDALGLKVEAEEAFDEIDGGDLDGREAARLHAWAAGFYMRSDRARLAATQLATAELEDPNWSNLVLLGAALDIRLNDGGGLRERLSQAMLKDLERDSSRNPIVLNYLPSIDSIEIADRATEAFGKSPELSNSIPGIVGAIHFLGCEREEACSSAQIQWERALRQDSEDWAARLGLARIYLRKGDWEMARTHIDPVLSFHGNRAVPNTLLGTALAGQGRLAESRDVLEKAARMDEGSTAAARSLVGVLVQLGEWEEAAAMSKIVRRLDPNDLVTASMLLGRPLATEKTPD